MPAPLPPNAFYLVSYPRSGNTWLINCLTMLVDGVPGEAYTAYPPYTEHHGEAGDGFYFWCAPRARPDQPVCVKSHDDLPAFRARHPAGPVVYVARDARDSLLSFYFFQQAYPTLNAEVLSTTKIRGTEVLLSRGGVDPVFIAADFSAFLRREAPLWAAHVAGARSATDLAYVTYEELKADFVPTLERLGRFLNLPRAKSVAEVEQVYHSGFSKVFSGSGRDFFRKGQVGDWRNWYTAEHALLLEELIGPQLRALGFESDPHWARTFTPAPARA